MPNSEMPDQKLSELIARFLGWTLDTEGWWHQPGCANPVNFDLCGCGGQLLLDIADPAMTVMLMEKMRNCRVYRDKGVWICESDWRFFHNDARAETIGQAVAMAFYKQIQTTNTKEPQ